MKSFVAVCLLASSPAVLANIYDIQYLPKAGTSFGLTDGEWVKAEDKNGSFDIEREGYVIRQQLGHSFTDRFSLSASMNYTDIETEYKTSGGPKFSLSGISDLTLLSRFRVLDESFRIDLLAGGIVGLGEDETKRNGDTNNFRGGHTLTAGAQVGQKHESFQWAFRGQYYRYLEADHTDSGFDYETDAFGIWALGVDLLNKLGEKSFLRSNVIAQIPEESTTVTTFGTEYQHLCSENFLARAGVDYQIRGEADDSGWIFNLGATYQF